MSEFKDGRAHFRKLRHERIKTLQWGRRGVRGVAVFWIFLMNRPTQTESAFAIFCNVLCFQYRLEYADISCRLY